MDTKWKSISRFLSFLIFFLGVSLTLGSLPGLLRSKPWTPEARTEDYQQSREFRWYISNRLENFLSIAINGCPAYGSYYNNPLVEETYLTQSAGGIAMAENLVIQQGADGAVTDYGVTEEDWADWEEWYYNEYGEFVPVPLPSSEDSKQEADQPLTEEQIREREERIAKWKQRITEAYFDGMQEDKNLLYSISHDGKLLYSNADLSLKDGSMQAPEGYNFLLYFDGEKVRITKDGKEADVYGDGYYREGNDWYVPGYRNFPVSDEMKKTVICIAAAREPVLYTVGLDKNGGYRQQENGLYWMQYRMQEDKRLLRRNLACCITGLVLLVLSCFCRGSRREAAGRLAAFQGRIWVECKILLLWGALDILLGGMRDFFRNAGSVDVWWELQQAYDGSAEAGVEYAKWFLSDLCYLSGIFWVVLFWTIYLTVNDIKHNRKVWRHGLIAKCCRAYSAREMKEPLSRRMVHRSAILLGVVIFCSILTLAAAAGTVYGNELWRYCEAEVIFVPWLLAALAMILAAWLVGIKNVKAAREVDALSVRIGEICNGDYADKSDSNGSSRINTEEGKNPENSGDGQNGAERPAGKDLGTAMEQLENIRQGMAGAVDEQMKSERMKVELIANVSHDLKTPLTSIISYVQFLKEEEGLPEHVKDYVRILDEKSQRLKNMVQDVFSVSKAASGELPMNMERLDFGKLLRQTLADMDEEIQGSGVSFRTEIPETPVMIFADGQRMYRVFQNLFQNALKYSLEGSRVYVALKVEGKAAVASVKNTSHMELNEDKNFTERFYRGDKSRTDGGSGLGLSIAQSFTEACSGQFELEFNADLFIVKVSFRTE